jgi:hypothetical protein
MSVCYAPILVVSTILTLLACYQRIITSTVGNLHGRSVRRYTPLADHLIFPEVHGDVRVGRTKECEIRQYPNSCHLVLVYNAIIEPTN